jgi:hypothetical protein
MFQSKHFALAAALAVSVTTAARHSKSWWDPTYASCSDGGQSVSVVGWADPGCIDAGVQMCVADIYDGACPDGAMCSWLSYDANGASVYGCQPGTWEPCTEPTDDSTCADGETTVSVVGWTDNGCVYDDPNVEDDVCVAGYYWGACPEDSACGWVTTDTDGNDVYGCYAVDLTPEGDECVPVSVVGWEYAGCIEDESTMCVADRADGDCPDGSYCDVVQWDADWNPSVYGCIDNYFYDYDDTDYAAVQAPCDEGYDEIGVLGWSANGCVPSGSDICVADVWDGVCPEDSECWPVDIDDNWNYVWGCTATWDYEMHHKSNHHRQRKQQQQPAAAASTTAKKNHSSKKHHGKKHN